MPALVVVGTLSFWSRPCESAETVPPAAAITSPAVGGFLSPSSGGLFSGTASDASGISRVRVYVYDEGRGAFSVDDATAAYTAASGTWSFAVQPAHLTAGTYAKLWVQVLDAAGNTSPWLSRRVLADQPRPVDTVAPALTITAPAAGVMLPPATGGVFSGTASDAGGISRVRVYLYDEGRGAYTVSDAAAAYTAASGTWSFAVQPAHLTAGTYVKLYAQAVDLAGNLSAWQSRRILANQPQPVDSTPPAITISAPAVDSLLLPDGGAFSGTASDAGGISRVRIYVYDEARGDYGVADATAAYTAASGTWSFAVQPGHVTPGAHAKLWAQAFDVRGNGSAWVSRRVLVQSPIAALGPSRVTVSGSQLLVARRRTDGTLPAAQPFKLRGVAYSPVDAGEVVESLGTARQHLRGSRYPEDFASLRELGANAIKTYVDPGTDSAAIALLDRAYQDNLMVAITLDPTMPNLQATVLALKSHPALLCWILGNEWNLNRLYMGLSLAEATARIESAAQIIQAADAEHPVASSLGFTTAQYNALGGAIGASEFPAIISGTPSVDLWGLNVYRNASLDPLFLEWALLSGKPMFLTEFGTDDWDALAGRVDEATQADTAAALWDEIHRHLSAGNPARQCVGGFVFAWNDEWWKSGNPASQDTGGFTIERTIVRQGTATALAVFRGHPDGVSNEEHYGLVTLARQRKGVFSRLQTAFALGSTRLDPVLVTVRAAANGAGDFAVFTKRGIPVAVQQAGGIHAVVIDRAAGTVSAMRRFDPDANAQAECAALRTFALGLRNGDVVLAGIAYSAVPPGVTMASTLMAPCLEGLNRLGARRALEIGPSQAWALVGIVGAATNLAEAVGGLREEVQASADVLLDADRDGLTDALDADNDNDGVTDSVERVNGTDILDPRPAL